MKKIVHIINCLKANGAQVMLYNLLSRMDRTIFEAEVVSLMDADPIGPQIERLGIPVHALGMRSGIPDPLGTLRLALLLQQRRPDMVHTWLYHSDLIGGVAAKLAGNIPVLWAVHATNPYIQKWSSVLTFRACALLSHHLPERVVCVSAAARDEHVQLGYPAEKMLVIPNGFDLVAFKPDPAARLAVRQELSLAPDTPLIGLVGRFHPQKDHHTFTQAAAQLHARCPGAHFLLCGDDITWENRELVAWIDQAGIRTCCHLLGRRSDMPRLTAACDIATTSSAYGEAFPMVVGEAMACAVPCVVTDSGDSARIVGDTGLVVPPRDPAALATAWHTLLKMGQEARMQLGQVAQRRIEQQFSLQGVVDQYETLYKELGRAANLFVLPH